MAFRIQVLTLQNTNLTFSCLSYETDNSGMIIFTDFVSNEKKYFHASRCEIKEITDEEYKKQVEKHNNNSKSGGWR